MFYWFMKSVALGPWIKLVFRPWIKGLENLPVDGPAILASNHLSFSDSVFLPLVLDRKIVFLGKSDYFTGKGLRGRLTASFMRAVGTIPVDRGGGRASEKALNTGLRILEEGGLFGIYPEGTRSPDGRLYRGKTGIARLAIESGAPVLPVAMIDTNKVQPIGQVVPKMGRVGVVIGKPLDFSRYNDTPNDRFVLRSVTDEIMYGIMECSGQKYVDIYAASMKARLARGEREPGAEIVTATSEVEAVAPGGRSVPTQPDVSPPTRKEKRRARKDRAKAYSEKTDAD